MTPKQQRFVEEYLVDLNASGAARRAGYSVHTSEAIGIENLRKPMIAAAIAAAQKARSDRTKVTVDEVVEDLRRLKGKAEQAEEYTPAIKATELLGKHVGAFEKDNKQRNPMGSFDPGKFFTDIFRKPVSE